MTGIVLLAAGESARLGQPKQKLLYQGKTLLEKSVEAAINSVCEPIIVILGAYANEFVSEIINKAVCIVENEDWQQGIGSSVGCGIKELQRKHPNVTDAIIMLCDQPFVDSDLLDKLVEKRAQSGKEIVACEYNFTVGVPVLFNITFFPQLQQLKGKEGAKKILFDNLEAVASVPFPLGAVDIDTAEDYNSLTNK